MPVSSTAAYQGVEITREVRVEEKTNSWGNVNSRTYVVYSAPALGLTDPKFDGLRRKIGEALKERAVKEAREAEARAKAAEHGETSLVKVVRTKVGAKPKKPSFPEAPEGTAYYLYSRSNYEPVQITGIKDNSHSAATVYYRYGKDFKYSANAEIRNLLALTPEEVVDLRAAEKARDDARKAHDESPYILRLEITQAEGGSGDVRAEVKPNSKSSPIRAFGKAYSVGFHPEMPDEPTLVIEVAGAYWPVQEWRYQPLGEGGKEAVAADLGLVDLPVRQGASRSLGDRTLPEHVEAHRALAQAADETYGAWVSRYKVGQSRFQEKAAQHRRSMAAYQDAVAEWESAKASVVGR